MTATTIRNLADALLAVRERDNRLSLQRSAVHSNVAQGAAQAIAEQDDALVTAIVRQPPEAPSDLRLLVLAAADEVERLTESADVNDTAERALRGVLAALEHLAVSPTLGPVPPSDERWNMDIYRKRAEARLIDPSQVQPVTGGEASA